METKFCRVCNDVQPVTEFYKSAKSGLQTYCKTHQKERTEAWRKINQLHVNADARKRAHRPGTRYKSAIRHARRRGLSFSLTRLEFDGLISQDCVYCLGKLPKVTVGGGIDRIDNRVGYEPGNCLPCCNLCNKIRNVFLTVDETKAVMQLVLKMRGLL